MKNIKLGSIYNRFEEVFLVFGFSVMVIVIFVQVIMRYVFNSSLVWSEELGIFCFQWITWVGISIGAREGQHIKISLLTDKLYGKRAQIVNILSEIIVIIICGLTLYYGIQLTSRFMGTRFPTLKISLGWGYAAVIVGCSLMIFRSIASIAKSIKGLRADKGVVA